MIIFKRVVFFANLCSNKYCLKHKIKTQIKTQIKFSLSKSLIYTVLTNYAMNRKSIKNRTFTELFPQNRAELEIKCQVKHIFPQKILSYIALHQQKQTLLCNMWCPSYYYCFAALCNYYSCHLLTHLSFLSLIDLVK